MHLLLYLFVFANVNKNIVSSQCIKKGLNKVLVNVGINKD